MDYSPVLISLKTAVPASILTFLLGTLAAYLVISLRGERLKSLLDAVLILPLVLPPTVAGFFLLYAFGVRRPLGSFLVEYLGVKIPFSWSATVLASVVVSFPLMYRSARGAFEQVDESLIFAARTLGMSEPRIFLRILLPLAGPGVASGAILAFARGIGEFGATAMIAGNIAGKTRTLPLAIYSSVASGNMEEAGVYVVIIMLIAFLAVAGMSALTSEKRRRYRAGVAK